jgi:hypothetical protein
MDEISQRVWKGSNMDGFALSGPVADDSSPIDKTRGQHGLV